MAEAHIRIDEGLKRGPRKAPKATRNALQPRIAFDATKLTNQTPEGLISRYIAGETGTEIAQSLGITRQGLSWWFRSVAEEDWKQAQVIQALEKKERAEDDLASAPDALALARAREQLRSAQWDLERVYHRIYGQKQEVTVVTEEKIEHILDGDAKELLERLRPKTIALHQDSQVIDLPSDAVQQVKENRE